MDIVENQFKRGLNFERKNFLMQIGYFSFYLSVLFWMHFSSNI